MAGSATVTGRQHYVLGIGHPYTTPETETPPVVVESTEFPSAGIIVVSTTAPDDNDGRPDGTIYIQLAA